jgi:hypothetical protein
MDANAKLAPSFLLKESIKTNEKKGIIATNRAIKPVFPTKFSTSINPLKYQF